MEKALVQTLLLESLSDLLHRVQVDHVRRCEVGQIFAPFSRGVYLLLDPVVRLPHALSERSGRCPAEDLLDESIVGVAAADALRALEVLQREVLACNRHRKLGEVVHGDHLIGPNVEWLVPIGHEEAVDAFDAVVDVGE